MKKFKLLSLATALTLGLASLNSCTEDKCKDVTCDNGGACVDGTCECADGYEGTTCQTETRTAFIGNYSVTSGTVTCPVSGNGNISQGTPVVISTSSSSVLKVSIVFAGISLTGTVNGSNVTLDQVTLNNLTYSGSGSVSGNTLTMSINEQDPSVGETCVYSFTAQK
jgi:hypothetical protein